ncbi:hypothetical protein BOTBODRAFT_65763 [Botryobasidium botryosum FD-172 SS1]|uniref:Mug135-like C-terminal domain-containing protein n=1 Tax=Botryobasidium botryosum (strain FD-172 SS1) TaxID=930990 RepID=A0A067MU88_BOTB1|nr:hypothetical protein BOTBODRAFT_65763 [Botryobasidium botryosum FD-172 SS1]
MARVPHPPVPLPPIIPSYPSLVRPSSPNCPPTTEDHISALSYLKNVRAAYHAGSLTGEHVSAAVLYEHNIAQAMSSLDAAPPWFFPAINTALLPVHQRLDIMEQRLDVMKQRQDRLSRLCALAWNQQAGNGSQQPFEIVLLPDGSDPTTAPLNLPLLSSVAAVDGLSAEDCTSYVQRYYPNQPVPHSTASGKQMILVAIGYSGF